MKPRTNKPCPLNSVQLWYLRNPSPDGRLTGDRCTLKALRDRGYAEQFVAGTDSTRPCGFYITDTGRQRASKAADVLVIRDGHNLAADPGLMQDLTPSQEDTDVRPRYQGP